MAVAAVASAAMSAAGAIQAGQAQKKMANYNARIAEDTARYQAERQQDRVSRLMASARVAINKSGITTSGSPLDVLADSAMQSELDHQAILRQGAAQAAMDRFQGSQAARAGYFGAATALLQGVGKAAGAFGGGGVGSFGGGSVGGASAYGLGDGVTFSLGAPRVPPLVFGNLAPG
jgi:hypothetical protein